MTPDDVTQTLLARARALADGVVALAPQLLIALIALLLTWAISVGMRYTIRRVGTRLNLRRNLVDVLILIAKTGIWVAGTLIALTIVFPTITPARALTTLGLGSVAVGLAFKDTFENFLAGILILLREPFAIGDFVECEGIEGQIEEITIRDTRIRRTDGQLVVMPNHTLFQNPVVVRTNRDVRRTTIICGVAYGEDVDAARAVIHDAVVAVDTVRDDVRDVQVFAHAFGSSSIDFEITWWTGSRPVDIRTSRDQVVAAVKRALDEAGIEIPFPYQTLTFKEPLPIRRMSSQDGDAAR
ncbi:MAG: mechanosensitive ion channel family protein [Pseudomonadota bacterium]